MGSQAVMSCVQSEEGNSCYSWSFKDQPFIVQYTVPLFSCTFTVNLFLYILVDCFSMISFAEWNDRPTLLWLDCRIVVPFLAKKSAFSLPYMFQWEGIHWKVTFFCRVCRCFMEWWWCLMVKSTYAEKWGSTTQHCSNHWLKSKWVVKSGVKVCTFCGW